MASITVSTTLEIPHSLLTYDIGQEAFCCKHCGAAKRFKVINRPSFRDGSPSTEQSFKNFIAEHGHCVGAYIELERQRTEAINSTRGGPGDR